jgi:ribosomal protein L31
MPVPIVSMKAAQYMPVEMATMSHPHWAGSYRKEKTQ